MQTMSKFDALILGILFGAVPILLCFLLVFIIGSSAGLTSDQFGPYALAALGAGLVIDITFLKTWVNSAYRMSNKQLGVIYVFYSIGALGFGMGVPIFNFAVGITAGFYTARKMCHIRADETQRRRNIKKTALFTAAVLMVMCCLTGFWALVGGLIGSRFETPVLSFTFTVPIIIGCVISGGLILCILQYWLTTAAKMLRPPAIAIGFHEMSLMSSPPKLHKTAVATRSPTALLCLDFESMIIKATARVNRIYT